MNPYLLVNLKQIYKPCQQSYGMGVGFSFTRLSHRSQVICALEACKMVLPKWEKYTYASKNKKLNKEKKEAPKKAIKIVEKWLEGKATAIEVEKVANVVAAAAALASVQAAYAAYAVTRTVAVINAKAATAAFESAAAFNNAAVAACGYGEALQFFNKWWIRCYSFIQKDFQDQYDILCKQITENI